MFRNVPACSGMFHVPGFIDGRRRVYRLGSKVERACYFEQLFFGDRQNAYEFIYSLFRVFGREFLRNYSVYWAKVFRDN